MRRGPAAPTKGRAAAPPARTMLWFRNDLRLTDNVIVAEAAAVGAPCLPVYIADPAVFGACTPPALGGRSRCGPHRARFVLEAVADLRARLRSVGSDLLVAVGDPVVVIPALLRAAASPALSTAASSAPPSPARTSVLVSDEPCPEEVATAEAVAAAVAREHGVLETRWQRTLYHPADLPPSVGIDSIAESSQRSRSYQFTSWRKKLEDELGQAERGIRPALPTPARLPPLWPSVRAAPDSLPEGIVGGCGFLPTLDDLGVPPTMHEVLWGIPPRLGAALAADTQENMRGGPENGLDPLVHFDSGCMAESNSGRFVGGETAGLARVQRWIGEQGGLASYVDTRNGLLGADFSSKFSPWLATGSLSPRTIIEAKARWEAEHGASRSSYWLYFELLWRDWFSWMAVIAGPALFCPAGPLVALSASPPRGNGWRAPKGGWKGGEAEFVAWAQGKTGWPLVDAGMRELAASGFSSNRARQNVASFLALELGCDWRLGAAWFEACLIDHDPTSNYGNWCVIALAFRSPPPVPVAAMPSIVIITHSKRAQGRGCGADGRAAQPIQLAQAESRLRCRRRLRPALDPGDSETPRQGCARPMVLERARTRVGGVHCGQRLPIANQKCVCAAEEWSRWQGGGRETGGSGQAAGWRRRQASADWRRERREVGQ